MKPIKITENTIKMMFEAFMAKYLKEQKDGSFAMDDGIETKEKVTILYTPETYLKMKALVEGYATEVGWYGLVEKKSDTLYRVYDVKLCKQYVSGGKVDTEDDDVLEFFDSLTDEELDHMHFQAHSHVNFTTEASGTDLDNQSDVLRNMGKKGFYIFQIWNKKDDINTYLYDLDKNIFYDRKDVVIEIEAGDDTMTSWVESTKKLVEEKKVTYYYPSTVQPKGKGKKKDKEPTYIDGYYNGYYGGYYQGGSDW